MRSNEIHNRLLESMFGAVNRYRDTPKMITCCGGDTEKDEHDDDDDDDDDDVKLQEVSFPFLTTTAWDPCFEKYWARDTLPETESEFFPESQGLEDESLFPFGGKLGPFQEQTFLFVLGRVLKRIIPASTWLITMVHNSPKDPGMQFPLPNGRPNGL